MKFLMPLSVAASDRDRYLPTSPSDVYYARNALKTLPEFREGGTEEGQAKGGKGGGGLMISRPPLPSN